MVHLRLPPRFWMLTFQYYDLPGARMWRLAFVVVLLTAPFFVFAANLPPDGATSAKSLEWWSVERINALASAFSAFAWPVLALIAVLIFRKSIVGFLPQVEELEFPGVKLKRAVQKKLTEAAEAVKLSPPFEPPSDAERARAADVDKLFAGNLAAIRQEAETLAYEYERVRASMSFSDERTRKMEEVVAKMRTMSQAIYPLRHELSTASSPGKRLLAIAALQVKPDYDMLDWLSERLLAEKPFVAYHALLALSEAANSPSATEYSTSLRSALKKAQSAEPFFSADTDRRSSPSF